MKGKLMEGKWRREKAIWLPEIGGNYLIRPVGCVFKPNLTGHKGIDDEQ